ncbi:hypothetical protein GEMRC1_001793 [Eukaryota sp. GEM-RC1]
MDVPGHTITCSADHSHLPFFLTGSLQGNVVFWSKMSAAPQLFLSCPTPSTVNTITHLKIIEHDSLFFLLIVYSNTLIVSWDISNGVYSSHYSTSNHISLLSGENESLILLSFTGHVTILNPQTLEVVKSLQNLEFSCDFCSEFSSSSLLVRDASTTDLFLLSEKYNFPRPIDCSLLDSDSFLFGKKLGSQYYLMLMSSSFIVLNVQTFEIVSSVKLFPESTPNDVSFLSFGIRLNSVLTVALAWIDSHIFTFDLKFLNILNIGIDSDDLNPPVYTKMMYLQHSADCLSKFSKFLTDIMEITPAKSEDDFDFAFPAPSSECPSSARSTELSSLEIKYSSSFESLKILNSFISNGFALNNTSIWTFDDVFEFLFLNTQGNIQFVQFSWESVDLHPSNEVLSVTAESLKCWKIMDGVLSISNFNEGSTVRFPLEEVFPGEKLENLKSVLCGKFMVLLIDDSLSLMQIPLDDDVISPDLIVDVIGLTGINPAEVKLNCLGDSHFCLYNSFFALFFEISSFEISPLGAIISNIPSNASHFELSENDFLLFYFDSVCKTLCSICYSKGNKSRCIFDQDFNILNIQEQSSSTITTPTTNDNIFNISTLYCNNQSSFGQLLSTNVLPLFSSFEKLSISPQPLFRHLFSSQTSFAYTTQFPLTSTLTVQQHLVSFPSVKHAPNVFFPFFSLHNSIVTFCLLSMMQLDIAMNVVSLSEDNFCFATLAQNLDLANCPPMALLAFFCQNNCEYIKRSSGLLMDSVVPHLSNTGKSDLYQSVLDSWITFTDRPHPQSREVFLGLIVSLYLLSFTDKSIGVDSSTHLSFIHSLIAKYLNCEHFLELLLLADVLVLFPSVFLSDPNLVTHCFSVYFNLLVNYSDNMTKPQEDACMRVFTCFGGTYSYNFHTFCQITFERISKLIDEDCNTEKTTSIMVIIKILTNMITINRLWLQSRLVEFVKSLVELLRSLDPIVFPMCTRRISSFFDDMCKAFPLLSASDHHQFVVVGDRDGSLHVFDRSHVRPRKPIKHVIHTSAVTCLCFSDDGSRLSTFSANENVVKIWNFVSITKRGIFVKPKCTTVHLLEVLCGDSIHLVWKDDCVIEVVSSVNSVLVEVEPCT